MLAVPPCGAIGMPKLFVGCSTAANAKGVWGTTTRRKCKGGEAGGKGTGRERYKNARHNITPSTRIQPYSPYLKPENLAALFPGKNRGCAILPHQSRGKRWLLPCFTSFDEK